VSDFVHGDSARNLAASARADIVVQDNRARVGSDERVAARASLVWIAVNVDGDPAVSLSAHLGSRFD
jgi:hypothetical protein